MVEMGYLGTSTVSCNVLFQHQVVCVLLFYLSLFSIFQNMSLSLSLSFLNEVDLHVGLLWNILVCKAELVIE